MDKDDIRMIGLAHIDKAYMGEEDYKDDGVAIYTSIKEKPIDEEPLRLDMIGLVACVKGKISIL